jgi:hypothetical protein
MKRFGCSSKDLPRTDNVKEPVAKETPQPQEVPQEALLQSQRSCNDQRECNPSECKHHHENIKLKEVLHSSLKEGTKMMMESSSIINNMKEEYEKAHSILLEENDILRKELLEVKSKLIEANEINSKEINEISSKLLHAEKLIGDSQKKEPVKPDVFTRLSQNIKSRKSTT